MPDITIRVRNRIAETVGSPEIICGNVGYNLLFDLDEEWSAQEIKTARIAWTDTFSGQPRHTDVPFILGFAAIPAIADAYEIRIGLYSGNIMTTTPATVPCVRCITDGETYHEDPKPDTYAALLELLGRISQGGVTVGDTTVLLEGMRDSVVGVPVADTDTVDLLTEPYASSLQNAAANTSGGLTPQTNRICCTEFVDFPADKSYFSAVSTISGTAAQVCVWLFDANGVYLDDATNVTDALTGKRYNQYTENGVLRTIPTNAAKMRVVTRLSTNDDIAISSLSAFNVSFY